MPAYQPAELIDIAGGLRAWRRLFFERLAPRIVRRIASTARPDLARIEALVRTLSELLAAEPTPAPGGDGKSKTPGSLRPRMNQRMILRSTWLEQLKFFELVAELRGSVRLLLDRDGRPTSLATTWPRAGWSHKEDSERKSQVGSVSLATIARLSELACFCGDVLFLAGFDARSPMGEALRRHGVPDKSTAAAVDSEIAVVREAHAQLGRDQPWEALGIWPLVDLLHEGVVSRCRELGSSEAWREDAVRDLTGWLAALGIPPTKPDELAVLLRNTAKQGSRARDTLLATRGALTGPLFRDKKGPPGPSDIPRAILPTYRREQSTTFRESIGHDYAAVLSACDAARVATNDAELLAHRRVLEHNVKMLGNLLARAARSPSRWAALCANNEAARELESLAAAEDYDARTLIEKLRRSSRLDLLTDLPASETRNETFVSHANLSRLLARGQASVLHRVSSEHLDRVAEAPHRGLGGPGSRTADPKANDKTTEIDP